MYQWNVSAGFESPSDVCKMWNLMCYANGTIIGSRCSSFNTGVKYGYDMAYLCNLAVYKLIFICLLKRNHENRILVVSCLQLKPSPDAV